MSLSKYIIFLFSAVLILYSCSQQNTKDAEFIKVKQEVDTLLYGSNAPSHPDSLLSLLHKYEKNNLVQADSALSGDVFYHLGRLNAMKGNMDTAQFYVEKAMERVENTNGNLDLKARIYVGMGNIWNTKAKEHQANYYYNKSASILLADSTISLSPQSKAMILLSAAQSNTMLFQYDLANQMNHAAYDLLPQLPPDNLSHQRTLVQIIQSMNGQGKSPDSIKIYLDKLEEIHRQYTENYDISFLYECKTKYFDRVEKYDSLLHYQLLKFKLDEEKYKNEPSEQTFVNNLFVTNTNLGGTYIGLNQKENASNSIQNAQKIYEKYPELITKANLIIFKNNHAMLADLQGKSQEALDLMQDAYQLQKENYQTENTQAVAEMNSLYQLQAKDRSIDSLSENIKINKLELQQSKLWLAIAALCTLLLFTFLLFFYYNVRQRRARQEKEKVLMQQQLLRTQMEPHFIFNTLGALQSFVRFDKKEKALKYLNQFSRLLRSSLELSRENLVPLGEEIEALQNYLSLQQMRFESAFSYEFKLPDEQDIDAIMVPPMLIQPYVENAILHGIDLDNNGNISIDFSIKNEILQINIADTGKKEAVNSAINHRSLSGTISSERIQLLGEHAKVETIKNNDGGTTVILQIPINN